MMRSYSAVSLTAFLSFIISAIASYAATGRTNVAMYYGQGANQQGLAHFCQDSTVDIIPLAFVNVFPAQGNGYPGTNFGNRCSGSVYSGPGYGGVNNPAKNSLQSSCPSLNTDIPICQAAGKKILLSLGGGIGTYQLTGVTDGQNFADFLWGAFGPRTSDWVAKGMPRPFDTGTQAVVIDGFDFDIELAPTDSSAGYIAMIQRLRSHFASTSQNFLITAAPQCVVPDANMKDIISAVAFDIIWIQFYNTAQCSARTWVNTGGSPSGGFSYDAWTNWLSTGASKNARLYLGLLGSRAGTTVTDQNYYLNPSEVASLIKAFFCRWNFGGVMLWEATVSDANINSGKTYYQTVKSLLLGDAQDISLACVSSQGGGSGGVFMQSSSTSSTASSTTSSSSLAISTDSTCGPTRTCKGSAGGQCCSKWGWCGSTDDYCGMNCNPLYGICPNQNSNPVVQQDSLTTIYITQTRTLTTYTQIITTTRTTTVSNIASAASSSSSSSSSSRSSSSTSTSSAPTTPAVPITQDGMCSTNGGGTTCAGSAFGKCCSQYGWCGNDPPWCGVGCQHGFGACS